MTRRRSVVLHLVASGGSGGEGPVTDVLEAVERRLARSVPLAEYVALDPNGELAELVAGVLADGDGEDLVQFFEGQGLGLGQEAEDEDESNSVPWRDSNGQQQRNSKATILYSHPAYQPKAP